ncbi:MAG: hypothetical protein FWF94_08225 [Oscillospiraceae bacterium]|nr:hypothetical protein [Oscillospiraceae bacterium]
MAYIKSEIIKKINEDGVPLYKRYCVNYRGKTSDTSEKVTEVIAEYLLTNIPTYETVTRSDSYKVNEHKNPPGYDPKNPQSNRTEELFARSLWGEKLGNLEILDYQIPLKNSNQDKGLGKIDLLAFDGENLVILELKCPTSGETLLRCVLEAYTYREIVDGRKLAKDFGREGADVHTAVLIFKGKRSQPYKDWRNGNQPQIKELMKRLKVGLYTLDNETSKKIEETASYH